MKLINGDCLNALGQMETNSIDSIVTDPPAGIAFMGKEWDKDKGGRDKWIEWFSEIMKECNRVLKPGGHALVWAIPRTSHWTATAIEDAGFEIRDIVTHIFGSGFPKSSALNRQKKDVFCQCASDSSSNESTSLSPCEDDHKDKGRAFSGGVSPISNGLYSKSKGSDYRDGCRCNCDLNGESLPPSKSCDQASLPLQGYVQGHNRSTLPDGVKACESSDTPSSAQCKSLPSNKDCYCQKSFPVDISSDIQESTEELASKPIPKGSDTSGNCKSNNVSKPLPYRSGTAFPENCQVCNKPKVDGWYNGGLKPSNEHWILCRKPISEKTIAKNVLKHGTGGINIDGCRIDGKPRTTHADGNFRTKDQDLVYGKGYGIKQLDAPQGRFPANTIVDDSAVAELDLQSGILNYATKPNKKVKNDTSIFNLGGADNSNSSLYGKHNRGGASRFFYCSKASKKDKGAGNNHPTPKNTKLMSYLIKLITPPNGNVLDPFMGSGSTGVAAVNLDHNFIGIEKEKDYFKIASDRIAEAGLAKLF